MPVCWCGCENTEPFSPDYVRCRECHTLISIHNNDVDEQVNASATDDEALYGADYWKKHMCEMAHVNSLDEYADQYLENRAAYWIHEILKHKLETGRAVEIGAGLGQLSYYLQMAGFDVTAMELSHEICEWIHDRMHLNTEEGIFQKKEKWYDLIAAIDLIEHLTDPAGWINDVAESLKNDGVLVLQTPCYDGESSFETLLERKARFLSLMIPEEHLYLFTRASMEQLLNRVGLKVIFEDAYFGNDYDMFCFASRSELQNNTEAEIAEFLYKNPQGRLLKAVIGLGKRNREYERMIATRDKELIEKEADILSLNHMLQSKNSSPYLGDIFEPERKRWYYTMLSDGQCGMDELESLIPQIVELVEKQEVVGDENVKRLLEYTSKYRQLIEFMDSSSIKQCNGVINT